MNWKDILDAEIKKIIIFNAPMKAYTTYKTGGAAEALALPKNEEQIIYIKNFCRQNNITFRMLGLGSNILVSDSGLNGITCCLKDFTGIEINGNELTALAGTPLDKAVEASVQAGLAGMESLSGIPGSCGGAVYMNAGAFGQETFDKIKCFKIILPTGEIKDLCKSGVTYGYRKLDNIENCIILSATWLLDTADAEEVKKTRLSVLARRAEKQPLEYPSAGSVFKRPGNDYASRLIDVSGLRGLRIGGAMVSDKHAGFIINYDNATAQDIYELINKVQEEVYKKTSIQLQREQILWGNFADNKITKAD